MGSWFVRVRRRESGVVVVDVGRGFGRVGWGVKVVGTGGGMTMRGARGRSVLNLWVGAGEVLR